METAWYSGMRTQLADQNSLYTMVRLNIILKPVSTCNHCEGSNSPQAPCIVDKIIAKPCPPKLFPYKLNTNKIKASSDSVQPICTFKRSLDSSFSELSSTICFVSACTYSQPELKYFRLTADRWWSILAIPLFVWCHVCSTVTRSKKRDSSEQLQKAVVQSKTPAMCIGILLSIPIRPISFARIFLGFLIKR